MSAWSEDHVRRLFWRAGFGATPEEARRWADAGQDAAIRWLLDGGSDQLVGPAPTVDGKPIDPLNEWSHDVLWWLDRMVRSQRPLEEKLTLFWHDHFATNEDKKLMLAQNKMLRRRSLGTFRKLLGDVTRDPAMQLFLSLAGSSKDAPNENFARELMELFTLGTGYSENDIREAARALTGWEAHWRNGNFGGITYKARNHDAGPKTIFGKRGTFGPDDVLDLVCAHRAHAPFLAGKLWEFFVTEPLDAATRASLARTYTRSGGKIKPLVEAILRHPALYARLDAPDMVKSPVVYVAGTLRTAGKPINSGSYGWLLAQMGQYPFDPPSVAGWEWGPAWMSTSTIRARKTFADAITGWGDGPPLRVPDGTGDPALSPDQQVEAALDGLGRPWISAGTRQVLVDVAAGFFTDLTKSWQQGKPKVDRADMLQRLLRHLLISGPDAHLH